MNNQLHKDFKSKLYSVGSVEYSDMTDSSNNKTSSPSLNIYFQHLFSKQENITCSFYGLNNSTTYNRYYTEDYENKHNIDLISNVKEKQLGGGVSLLYEKQIKTGIINIGLTERSTFTRDNYNNTWNSSQSSNKTDLDLHNLYLYAQFGNKWKRLYYRIGVGANSLFQSVNNDTRRYTVFRPSVALTYSLSNSFEINYTGSVYPTMPTLSAISSYDQKIDSLQLQRGNPALKPQVNYKNGISLDFDIKKIGFGCYLDYTYVSSPLMESSFAENNKVVRTINNQKNFQILNPELELRSKPFDNYIQLKIYTGINKYISTGNNFLHNKTIVYYGGKIKVNYKKYSLTWLVSQNTSDSFWGETLSRDESAHVVTLSYNNSKIYVGLEGFNLFSTKHTNSKENLSSIAPYTRYEYLDELRNMLRFKITYTLKYGREYKAKTQKIRNTDEVEQGILKGEK